MPFLNVVGFEEEGLLFAAALNYRGAFQLHRERESVRVTIVSEAVNSFRCSLHYNFREAVYGLLERNDDFHFTFGDVSEQRANVWRCRCFDKDSRCGRLGNQDRNIEFDALAPRSFRSEWWSVAAC